MGLRESLDEGAGEIGEGIGAEIPSTPTELREELPVGVEELRLWDGGPGLNDGRQSTNGQGPANGRDPTNSQEQSNAPPSTDVTTDAVLGDTPLDRFL